MKGWRSWGEEGGGVQKRKESRKGVVVSLQAFTVLSVDAVPFQSKQKQGFHTAL